MCLQISICDDISILERNLARKKSQTLELLLNSISYSMILCELLYVQLPLGGSVWAAHENGLTARNPTRAMGGLPSSSGWMDSS